jgi:hypothetical protein
VIKMTDFQRAIQFFATEHERRFIVKGDIVKVSTLALVRLVFG